MRFNMKQFMIYDIEIEKAIQGRGESRIDGIEYCNGWEDHEGMGISVICAYDYATGRFRVFTKSNRDEFSDLSADRCLVGFNNRGFDNKVLSKCWGIFAVESIDILVGIWKGAGLGPDFNYKTHGGYGLDACCETNFGVKKTGNGALAPVDWQLGKIGNVIDYCLNDVYLTKRLFETIQTVGEIRNPKNTSEFIKISLTDMEA